MTEDARAPRLGSLGALYAQHAPGARALAYLLSGDLSDAEDLVHEAFVRVAGRLRHLREPEAFPSYLRSAIVNLHVSRLRRLRRERLFLRQQTYPVEVQGRDLDLARDIQAILKTLPRRQRAAVVLRYYEDLSQEQIAEAMGCSIPAVKSLLTRATRTIRVLIDRGDVS